MAETNLRRSAIPILYTKGTHYDVGFDVGRTFASMITKYIHEQEILNKEYIPLFNTTEGKKVYEETLTSVKSSFPEYIRELEGIAVGAQCEFYKLFLLHMDDILPITLKNKKINHESIGCSDIILNNEDCRILAHTEDALALTLNNFYFVDAHIINDDPQGKYQIKEEKFMSLCYPGQLPGYTMSYNHHGCVFTINTISAQYLKTRHFLTRALLSAENYEQAIEILKDSGVGAADACSINLTFLKNNDSKMCYNIEMGPADHYTDNESQLNIREISIGDYFYHCNKFLRLNIPEIKPPLMSSSEWRHKVLESYKKPKTKEDIKKMLGDTSGKLHNVFRESGSMEEKVKTIAVGIFDLHAKTYEVYTDNPKYNEAIFNIPLVLKEDNN